MIRNFMNKYICTVKAIIPITKEVTDTIEIEAPDEVQAEEDAETAAGIMDKKIWLEHPQIDYNEFLIEDVFYTPKGLKYKGKLKLKTNISESLSWSPVVSIPVSDVLPMEDSQMGNYNYSTGEIAK